MRRCRCDMVLVCAVRLVLNSGVFLWFLLSVCIICFLFYTNRGPRILTVSARSSSSRARSRWLEGSSHPRILVHSNRENMNGTVPQPAQAWSRICFALFPLFAHRTRAGHSGLRVLLTTRRILVRLSRKHLRPPDPPSEKEYKWVTNFAQYDVLQALEAILSGPSV
jgi:hypothetical protein